MVKIEKSKKTVWLFLALMLGTFVLDGVFIYPCKSRNTLFVHLSLFTFNFTDIYSDGWFPLVIMIFIAAMTFFGLTVKISPGYMRGTSNVPFVRLVEKFEANLLCPKCEVICTAESRHCYICDQCVERFDHHCQWVDNCIGKENHSYFYIFIILQDLYLVIVVIMAILSKSSDKIASEFIHCFHSLYNIVCLFY